jgi:hypothetical protein
MASFASLVNSQRLENGASSLGWLTPALYLNGSSFVWDIVEGGKNNCSGATAYNKTTGRFQYNCCPQGFPTTPGWDAATGLGSVNYTQFLNVFAAAVVTPQVASTDDDSYTEGEIVVIVVGCVIGVGLFVALCYYIFFKMTKGPMAAQGVVGENEQL